MSQTEDAKEVLTKWGYRWLVYVVGNRAYPIKAGLKGLFQELNVRIDTSYMGATSHVYTVFLPSDRAAREHAKTMIINFLKRENALA